MNRQPHILPRRWKCSSLSPGERAGVRAGFIHNFFGGSFFFVDKHYNARHSIAMLAKELIAASTVPLVLSVLTEGENYGYALIQRVRELSGGKIEWTEGMLYPVLHWMEDGDLIESEWREAETGRKRKYYRLRKEGRKALQEEKKQWLTVHETLAKLWNQQPRLT